MSAMKNEDGRKLKKALTAAYYAKEGAGPEEIDLSGAMNRIRRLGPLPSKGNYFDFFGHFLWRLAPVACLLILGLVVALSQVDTFSDYEVAKVFLEDPADYSLPYTTTSF